MDRINLLQHKNYFSYFLSANEVSGSSIAIIFTVHSLIDLILSGGMIRVFPLKVISTPAANSCAMISSPYRCSSYIYLYFGFFDAK